MTSDTGVRSKFKDLKNLTQFFFHFQNQIKFYKILDYQLEQIFLNKKNSPTKNLIIFFQILFEK